MTDIQTDEPEETGVQNAVASGPSRCTSTRSSL